MFTYDEVAKICGVTKPTIDHDIRYIRKAGFGSFADGGFQINEVGFYVIYLNAKNQNNRQAGIRALFAALENQDKEIRSYFVEKRIITIKNDEIADFFKKI